MKVRTLRHVAIGLLLLPLSACSARDAQQTPVLDATINRDCAPWDGSAFTVSVPWEETGMVYISIWRAPDIPHRMEFSFPDPDMRVGNAAYRTAVGQDEILGGVVTLEGVQPGIPVEGEMRLSSAIGAMFVGRFRAEWGTTAAYCG